ncbi:MAG: winged helix-turn-helix transcriptional regulator [Lachnospiraceae bacterium]|nr:winged helix-turn-helix transcriptional regulator [Lachnospiraceae bacterium]
MTVDANKLTQVIRIAKMHYELHYSQLEIAEKEGISKSSVSRILKSAMDEGIIEVRIKDAILSNSSLEKELLARFPITRAVLIPDIVGNQQILLQDVCAALVDDLPRYIKNNSVVGVAWGRTLSVLAKQLQRIKRSGVSVIQFSGGFSRAMYESSALEILKKFADCVGGDGYQIPAPAMVDQPFIAEALKQDSQIRHVLNLAESCRTAIFSVGNLERPSVLYEMGVINEKDYLEFRKRGAVGDCCSHFLNENGGIFDPELDRRVIGASLDIIKKIPNKLLVVCGKEKEEVITAALKGGLVDSLYIDAPTAEEIIRKNPLE